MKLRAVCFLLAAGLLLVLTACGCAGGEDFPPEVTTLIYAQLSENGVDRDAINRFNRTHENVQIEIRNYTKLSENGKQGIDLLLTELAVGRVPDIIELGTDGQNCILPYRRMAERGYLEDLWPYIENDPDIGRDAVVEAPLKAAEVNGGLYTVFDSVWLHTLVGAASVVGDRTSWTMEDMMDALASMPEGTILMDNDEQWSQGAVSSMKEYLFSCLLCCFVDSFVDWETGQCSFDSQQFRNVLEFVDHTPEEYAWREECTTKQEVSDMLMIRKLNGQVMLEQRGFFKLYNLRFYNFYFNGRAAFVGYPVEDGSIGAYFEPLGIKLAMSSTCQDKKAAWEYIRQTLLLKKAQYPDLVYEGVPVIKKLYKENLHFARTNKQYGTTLCGRYIPLDRLSGEECQRIDDYFNSVTRCSLFLETDLLNIVREGAAPYFAGDLTLDQAVGRIQNRASLYVNESR